ncbi:MAG: flavodoxin/nitric oxide synthase [bacterium P3]|nr:MAG: flavodoxin/nitric oxide synthase [bacterium P3]KWW41487.1 MAG: flavodoxin/nitric oxide synthase [bacterium F083]
MHNIRKISTDLYYIGASDRKLALFENIYPVPHGVSYNSYVLLDSKTVLFDTVDTSVSSQFFDNLRAALAGRKLDYIVVHHMEPDHAATLQDLLLRHHEATVVTTAKAAQMIEQFFGSQPGKLLTVKEGDTLATGSHTLCFIMAPMVHWPEVMMTYDTDAKTLFSADAFGTFGALSGNLFADEMDFEHEWLGDARRYYINIVGKYGIQVQNVLKKAAALDIQTICPLHGPVWRSEAQPAGQGDTGSLGWFIGKHDTWSKYEPEDKAVVIIYGSIYGHTEAAALRLGTLLGERGIRGIKAYDASHTHASKLVAECFRVSHIVLASSTYNNGLFTPMENLLADLKAHCWQRRTVAIIENGSWAPQSGKLMRAELEQMKDITLVGDTFSLKSAMQPDQEEQLATLADEIVKSL